MKAFKENTKNQAFIPAKIQSWHRYEERLWALNSIKVNTSRWCMIKHFGD